MSLLFWHGSVLGLTVMVFDIVAVVAGRNHAVIVLAALACVVFLYVLCLLSHCDIVALCPLLFQV